ncbi:MAG: hypothetical protein WKG06_02460 [Segetibacter sp.]
MKLSELGFVGLLGFMRYTIASKLFLYAGMIDNAELLYRIKKEVFASLFFGEELRVRLMVFLKLISD